MNVETFVLFLLIGKLIMFLARKSPYFQWGDFLKALLDCELCLGVWVYFLLALVFHLNLFSDYVPLLSESITGSVMSFVMWLLTEGWNAKFRELHIDVE